MASSRKSFAWDIFDRRSEGFSLWTATKVDAAPILCLGKILRRSGGIRGEFYFKELVQKPLQESDPTGHGSLWELKVTDIQTELSRLSLSSEEQSALVAGEGVYHYWFKVKVKVSKDTTADILVTDPFATAVDYRLVQDPDGINQPASVIKIDIAGLKLLPCDPGGQELTPVKRDQEAIEKVPKNKELVIYELPTSWTKADSDVNNVRDTGTFRDVLALLEQDEPGTNFANLDIVNKHAIVADLGINALELLPSADAKTRGEWGYAPAHYFAPDYDLGGGNLSASTDFADLAQHCLDSGIRLINDVVMGFGHDPYKYINFDPFHVSIKYDEHHHQWEIDNNPDPDAWQSFRNQELRNNYGGTCWRYIREVKTYNPYDGEEAKISPARAFHKAHLAWWMSKYQLGGLRLDSVNNVASWDFVREFRADAYKHCDAIYGDDNDAHDRFLVIGEELNMPIDVVKGSNRPLDAIWNEEFQRRIRAVIVGQSWGEDSGSEEDKFKWTVRKLIDCTRLNLWDPNNHFDNGLQAVNYITSHDTEGDRKERFCNYLQNCHVTGDSEKAQRCKLAFACLLTAVGIPMIFAGEEFCDEGDQVFVHPYKQRDPVNWKRLKDSWRADLFEVVKRLVTLRKSSPALTNLEKESTDFIYSSSGNGRVQAWVRKSSSGDDKVVVVANFSDEGFPNGYTIRNWPSKPNDKHWHDVIADVRSDRAGNENLRPWDVKVYKLL